MIGDGATIRKMPLINILASGVHCPFALLEIVDCTKHLATGGSKTAEYIAGLMAPHVEVLGAKNVDLFLFDGAANVQKAGKLMAIDYPRSSCFHSGEHLASLWLNDVANTHHVTLLIRFYRQLYHYFGGTVHQLYAVLQKNTWAANQLSGHALGLFRLCRLCMGGVFQCFLRLL